MPIITPENSRVRALKGVHLFHSPFSNCSQRSRLVLEEKGIAWESHAIDLMAFEHLTPDYQSLHPKGVVPALVHDGVAVVESHDIIQYLDDHFPGPALMPQSAAEKARVMPWMELGDELQISIKTLTYDRIFRPKFPPSEEKFAFYAAHQRNPALVDFYRRYLEGFDPGDLERCVTTVDAFLARADATLAGQAHLAGDDVSLADFSAVVNVHRAGRLGLPLGCYPRLSAWYDRMAARPSFQNAILAYVP